MRNDYAPLDQKVIDQKVEAIRTIRTALKSAGGTADIAVFHQDDRKSVIKALTELKIFWCEVDEKIYVNRHDFMEI